MPSPVRLSYHAQPHAFIMTWLGAYVARLPGVILADNATVYLDAGVEIQPDALLWRPDHGPARLTSDGYLDGPPELIVEVAASSASYDLHEKQRSVPAQWGLRVRGVARVRWGD